MISLEFSIENILPISQNWIFSLPDPPADGSVPIREPFEVRAQFPRSHKVHGSPGEMAQQFHGPPRLVRRGDATRSDHSVLQMSGTAIFEWCNRRWVFLEVFKLLEQQLLRGFGYDQGYEGGKPQDGQKPDESNLNNLEGLTFIWFPGLLAHCGELPRDGPLRSVRRPAFGGELPAAQARARLLPLLRTPSRCIPPLPCATANVRRPLCNAETTSHATPCVMSLSELKF